MSSMTIPSSYLDETRQIAHQAGKAILEHYGTATVTYKDDRSPLTTADSASHALIVDALCRLTPRIPVVSEESAPSTHSEQSACPLYWLVDPLDGTKEFLKRSGDFTVNIALISEGESVLGVVYAPVPATTYFAQKGSGAWVQRGSASPTAIQTNPANTEALRIVASKDHAGPEVEAMLNRLPGASLKSIGSSLKFCLVAEGAADLYPRFVPTMEWDTGAAQCVVEAAGGFLVNLDGTRLQYGKNVRRNASLMTYGDPHLDWKSLLQP